MTLRTKVRFDRIDRDKPFKIGRQIDTDNWDITFYGSDRVLQQVINDNSPNGNVVSFYVEVEFKELFIKPSGDQWGFLHAGIFPAFYQFYEEAGHRGMLKEEIQADLLLHPIVGFYDVRTNKLTGRKEKIARRLSKASKKEITTVIDGLLQLADELDIKIDNPKEKKSKKFH